MLRNTNIKVTVSDAFPVWFRVGLLVLIQIAILAWLFRANLVNGFSFVLGDHYDNLIEVSILEHWYNVLRGLEHWATTAYFYPYPKTLGYNDGYLLYGMIYSLFRSLGSDPLLSAMLVNICMKIAAFAFFFLFAKRVLQMKFWYAVLGAAIFELSNNVVTHNLHAQLLTVAFVPLCAMLLYFAGKALLNNDSRRLYGYGSGFALAFGMWAITSYYMLWFFSFFTVLLLLMFAAVHCRYLCGQLLQLNRKTLLAAAVVLVLLVMALLPFLLVYLPKASETGMHSYTEAKSNLLAPFDILNIGEMNYLYGALVRPLHESIGFPIQFSENQMGLPPVLLLIFLLGTILAWRKRANRQAQLVLIMALGALALWALALVIDGQSAWVWIFSYFPGAKAVRVIARIMIFLVFPVACVVMYFLSSLRHRLAGFLILPCSALLITEELNRVGATHVERAVEVRMLDSIPAAPSACRAFFVQDLRPANPNENFAEHDHYRHNVEAMLISEYLNLPTINGFSSFNPPDWDFGGPDRPDYTARVAAYRARHKIQGLCALDLQYRTWSIPVW